MRQVEGDVEELRPLRAREYEPEDFPRVFEHPTFQSIRFYEVERWEYGKKPEDDARLAEDLGNTDVRSDCPAGWGEVKPPKQNDRDRSTLASHSLVAHSFATFPPVEHMVLVKTAGIMGYDEVYRSGYGAITILDVVNTIHCGIDTKLSGDDIADYLEHHQGCVPERHSVPAMIRAVGTLRKIFNICPIHELRHEETHWYDGPMMVVEVK